MRFFAPGGFSPHRLLFRSVVADRIVENLVLVQNIVMLKPLEIYLILKRSNNA